MASCYVLFFLSLGPVVMNAEALNILLVIIVSNVLELQKNVHLTNL